MPKLFVYLDDAGQVIGTNDEVHVERVPPEFRDAWIEAPLGTKIGARQVDGEWVNPPEPPAPDIVVTVSAFFQLFTIAEEAAIRASQDPAVAILLQRLDRPQTTHVNLSLQSIRDAFGYLVGIELLTPDRAAEILTGVVS